MSGKRPPSVGFSSPLVPWGHPQQVPSGPANLPRGSRMLSLTRAAGITPVRDDHHYAVSVIDGATPAGQIDTSFLIIDAPPGLRNLLMFRNTSATQTVYIGFGKDATTTSTLAVSPGQIVLFDTVVPQDEIYALGSAAGATLSYAYSNIPG